MYFKKVEKERSSTAFHCLKFAIQLTCRNSSQFQTTRLYKSSTLSNPGVTLHYSRMERWGVTDLHLSLALYGPMHLTEITNFLIYTMEQAYLEDFPMGQRLMGWPVYIPFITESHRHLSLVWPIWVLTSFQTWVFPVCFFDAQMSFLIKKKKSIHVNSIR